MAKKKIIQVNKASKVVVNPLSTKGTSTNSQNGKIIIRKKRKYKTCNKLIILD